MCEIIYDFIDVSFIIIDPKCMEKHDEVGHHLFRLVFKYQMFIYFIVLQSFVINNCIALKEDF